MKKWMLIFMALIIIIGLLSTKIWAEENNNEKLTVKNLWDFSHSTQTSCSFQKNICLTSMNKEKKDSFISQIDLLQLNRSNGQSSSCVFLYSKIGLNLWLFNCNLPKKIVELRYEPKIASFSVGKIKVTALGGALIDYNEAEKRLRIGPTITPIIEYKKLQAIISTDFLIGGKEKNQLIVPNARIFYRLPKFKFGFFVSSFSLGKLPAFGSRGIIVEKKFTNNFSLEARYGKCFGLSPNTSELRVRIIISK